MTQFMIDEETFKTFAELAKKKNESIVNLISDALYEYIKNEKKKLESKQESKNILLEG